jgi:hypothetical protein
MPINRQRRNIIISNIDIEAWREDEKQTQFLEERRLADNHEGWVVEMLTKDGWFQVGGLFTASRDAAVVSLISWQKWWPAYEFRVYERVVSKEKK